MSSIKIDLKNLSSHERMMLAQGQRMSKGDFLYHRDPQIMAANGMAVVLVNVARRSNRPGNCPGARRAWRNICPSERRQPGGQSRVRLA
jgi:hypothetical protein